MKKLFFTIALLALAGLTHAQSGYISQDSMTNSPNPGQYFINFLKGQTVWTATDTNEGDDKHADTRSLDFWLDRMPAGTNIDSPFYKYNYMLRNRTRGGCNPAAGAFNGNWENTGPKTTNQAQGIVWDIHVDPTDDDKILIGVEDAGLWKTTDGGGTWSCISDNFPAPYFRGGAGVSCIAVSKFDPDLMYIGSRITGGDSRNLQTWTYGQGIWKSTDGGVNWAIDISGVVDDFQALDGMEFCPYKINGGTDEMIIAYDDSQLLQKIGNGPWTNILPPGFTSLPIRDITFTPGLFGKFYVSTHHNWIEIANVQTYFQPVIYEVTYTNTGAVSFTTIIDGTNFGPGFQFFGTPNCNGIGFETAYAGSNKLYMIVAAFTCTTPDQGHHTLYSYNISTATWSFEYAMPDIPNWNKNRGCMGLEISLTLPDVLYLTETTPERIYKDGTGWHKDAIAVYMAPNFHADQRCAKIYVSDNTATPPGSADVVYWGNDGGISRTVGNTSSSLNGLNFWTSEVYDIDVSPIKRKRVIASMHNSIYGTNSANGWDNIPDVGDGFSAIYDKRFDLNNARVLYSNGDWQPFEHNNTNLAWGAFSFQSPTITGGIDELRAFDFPDDLDGDLLYLGNKNMLCSQPMGYGTWQVRTNTGSLDGTDLTIGDITRAIVVTPQSTANNRKYYGIRNPEPDLVTGLREVFFVESNGLGWLDWTPSEIQSGEFNLTDIVVDPEDNNKVFISLGMVRWPGPDNQRVLQGIFNPGSNTMAWSDMSTGLTQLPVTCLAYQNGTDDVIYAGTDAGVFRWDKPQQCWVNFDDALAGSGAKMPNVLVHDMEIDYCSRRLVVGCYGRGVWESDLYYPNFFPDPTETISANTTWGTTNPADVLNKYIEGSILVKSGATLTIQGVPNLPNNAATTSTTTIYMPRWAKINVEKGARLIVNGAHITNDCGVNWYGIFAYGDGTQPQVLSAGGLDANHGVVKLNDFAIIEFAEEALNNNGGTNNPNTGGIIQVDNSHFINNHRSAAFSQYYNTTAGIVYPDLSYLNASLFDLDDNVRAPFYAHITMWDTRGINVTQNVFNNTQTLTATSPDHKRALYTEDAGYNFLSNEVNDFYKGIESNGFAYKKGGSYPVIIRDNHFYRNEIGIHLLNMIRPVINGNSINIGAKQTPTPSGQTSYYSLGTKMENVSNFIYSENYLHNIAAYAYPGLGLYTAGTEVQNTGQNYESITLNKYEDLLIGNDADMTCCDGTGNNGLNYSCNINVNNERFDFIFQATPLIRTVQTGAAASSATGNILTTQNATCASWNHVTGGNGPVKYFYTPVTSQTLNGLSFNVTTTATSIPSGCENDGSSDIARMEHYDYESFTEEEMGNLKMIFKSEDSAYMIYNTLYLQLLDNGSTEALVEEIASATIAEQLATRATFLSISPYVTRDALLKLAMQEIVSNPILLEILLANPDATREEILLDYLENKMTNPLPNYMIDMIRASWSSPETPRGLLVQNMTSKLNQMTLLKNHIMRVYQTNTDFINSDSIDSWMQKIPNIRNTYEMIEHQLYSGNMQRADSLLNTLLPRFIFTASDSVEYTAFVNLHNFKKALLEDSLEINQLDSTRIAQLKEIADAEAYTFPRSMARSALCFFYQMCYPDTVRELPNISSRPAPKFKNEEKSKEITVYPNPANDYVVCYYDLAGKQNDAKEFIVNDITGKQIYKVALKGMQGQHIWDTRNVGNGNYIYTVVTGTGEKYSGKITIAR